jgi:hypothetical protein
MYEALHQRNIKIEVIIGETNSPYGTNTRNTNINRMVFQIKTGRWIMSRNIIAVVDDIPSSLHEAEDVP